jgi:hypothetical protein
MTAEEKAAELYPYWDGLQNASLPKGPYNKWIDVKRQDFIAGYNYKASQHEWVKCSDRLPTEADAVYGMVEICYKQYLANGRWAKYLYDYKIVGVHLSDPSFFKDIHWRTPLRDNFPQPPKTEI